MHQLVKPIFHKLLLIIVMIVTITIRSIDKAFAQDMSYYRCSHHQYNMHIPGFDWFSRALSANLIKDFLIQ